MSLQEIFTEEDLIDDLRCEDTQHDIVVEGEDDNPYYFCIKCGYQANMYVVNNWVSY